VMGQFKTFFNQRGNQVSSPSSPQISTHPQPHVASSTHQVREKDVTSRHSEHKQKQKHLETDMHQMMEGLPPPPSADYSPDARLYAPKKKNSLTKNTTVAAALNVIDEDNKRKLQGLAFASSKASDNSRGGMAATTATQQGSTQHRGGTDDDNDDRNFSTTVGLTI
jgi:hypothetical protein